MFDIPAKIQALGQCRCRDCQEGKIQQYFNTSTFLLTLGPMIATLQ